MKLGVYEWALLVNIITGLPIVVIVTAIFPVILNYKILWLVYGVLGQFLWAKIIRKWQKRKQL